MINNPLIVQFENKKVRRQEYKGVWHFSIVDIIEILTNSENPRRYWSDLKRKLKEEEGFVQLYEKIVQLKLLSSDGKAYNTDTTKVQTLLRIIQSIPSPKVEPLKQWLARVGYERLEEVENPELAMKRMHFIYEKKGYPKDWIALRERSIAVRNTLTDEWKERGADRKDYSVLTAVLGKETFDLTQKQHKKVKNLKKENLRDHMSDLELILTMLGEATSTKLHQDKESHGANKLKNDTKVAGKIAGNTRKEIEKQTGKKVVTSDNYLDLKQNKKLIN